MTPTAAGPGAALIAVAGWPTIAGAEYLLVIPAHPDWNSASKRTVTRYKKRKGL